MANIKEKEIMTFSEHTEEVVNSSKPLSYATDGQFLICCSGTIYVCTLSCDLDVRSQSFSKSLPCNLFTQKVISLSALPHCPIAEGVIDLLKTLSKISLVERQDLLADTSLYPEVLFPKADLGGFRRALFPPFHSSSHRLFIGAITFDHRIFVFELQCGEWTLYCEFTTILRSHVTAGIDLPVTLGKECAMTLTQYKRLIHSMSSVEIIWSSPFGSKEGSADTLLLFCGMRNGDLHIWAMKTCLGSANPCAENSAFTFVDVDKYGSESEVTSLCWHSVSSDQGFVAIGYMDGGIRVLSVLQSSNFEFEIREQFRHEPKDHVAVFDLAIMQMDRNMSILLAAKQFFIEIYRIQDGLIEYCKVMHIDCSLPLESISVSGKFGSAHSQDGTIFHFRVHVERTDICVQLTRSNIACLPSGGETRWECKGVVLSPNGALCISIHRPSNDYPIKFRVRSRFLERQKVVLSLTPDFPDDGFVFPFASTFPAVSVSIADVTLRLLMIIQNNFKNYQSLEFIEKLLDLLKESERMENLQIARDIYFFEFFKIHQTTLQPLALKFSGESISRELDIKIVCKHISCCFHVAKELNVNLFSVLPFMQRWLNYSEDRRLVLLQYLGAEEQCSSTSIECDKYFCYLCEAELVSFIDLLVVKCARGHSTHLCCLTLSPIKVPKFRRCLSCNTTALGLDELEKMDVPFLKSRHLCTLCGGRLQ